MANQKMREPLTKDERAKFERYAGPESCKAWNLSQTVLRGINFLA
jgi:hypothetical protein